ncbi:hypothetical protein ACU4GD_28280 [Cupriavidus basilensis]
MDIVDAFAVLEHLPAKERLVIGRPVDGGMDWSSGHIDEIDLVDHLGASVVDAINDFRASDGLMRVMIVGAEPTELNVVVMGPESVSAIVDALTSAHRKLAARIGH